MKKLTLSFGSSIRSSTINARPTPPIRTLRRSPHTSIFSFSNPGVHKLTDPRRQPVFKYSSIDMGIHT